MHRTNDIFSLFVGKYTSCVTYKIETEKTLQFRKKGKTLSTLLRIFAYMKTKKPKFHVPQKHLNIFCSL